MPLDVVLNIPSPLPAAGEGEDVEGGSGEPGERENLQLKSPYLIGHTPYPHPGIIPRLNSASEHAENISA